MSRSTRPTPAKKNRNGDRFQCLFLSIEEGEARQDVQIAERVVQAITAYLVREGFLEEAQAREDEKGERR